MFFFIQGESGNAQPPPTGAVATVPYYAQPTPVNIVSRPQMVIPVTAQPPFHAGTRPTIVHSTAIPTQIPWQPATVQYQEVRPAAFQPVMHYGAVPQASSGGPGQAAYGVATGAGVHYVRGVKDIQGQGGIAKYNHNGPFCSFLQYKINTGNVITCFLLYKVLRILLLLTHVIGTINYSRYSWILIKGRFHLTELTSQTGHFHLKAG